MIFLLAFFFIFIHSQDQIVYAPAMSFEIAHYRGTIKEHMVNVLNPADAKKYREHLDFFLWHTPRSNKNHVIKRFVDRKTNYGVISKYLEAYKQGFELIENNKFSVIQIESEKTDGLKTFVILNFTSNDSAHVNHLMDFINIHRD